MICLNSIISLMTNFDRNIDKACSWIFPLLADGNGNLKMQIFVLRKDTADILGKNCNECPSEYSNLRAFHVQHLGLNGEPDL